jgi:hypothetical protein
MYVEYMERGGYFLMMWLNFSFSNTISFLFL